MMIPQIQGLFLLKKVENSIDYDQITVIPPTPKKKKRNDFVSTSEQQNSRNTCTETSQQHVHWEYLVSMNKISASCQSNLL